ncbi:MAG: thiolase family protein [Deltaproteobacteria bacterium]|nr:thiolase family protein [Deltaproteobacteria bacterium]
MVRLQEVVVIDAVRSPIGKSGVRGMEKNGQLCQASAQDLLAHTLRGLLDRVHAKSSKFNEDEVEDVIVGCLSQIGEQGLNIARVAALLAGITKEAAACTVNQYCNAGLKAINIATHEIMLGEGDIIICGGVEVMSHYGMGSDLTAASQAGLPVRLSARFDEAGGMSVPQGLCAEIISEDQKHSREDLDRFALKSMQSAVLADHNGWFADHLIPFDYVWEDQTRRCERDEVLRPKAVDDPDGFLVDLARLKPAFKEGGRVTAGNSSQIVDGAAACLLMSADKAEKWELEPLCKITACAVSGGDPMPMLLAPITAARKALKRVGKTMDEMDIIEPNEAFASPLLQFADELGYGRLDPRVNPTGGAIALGHPIGASGGVYFAEMVHHLKRTKGRAAIQMMCGGGGLGIATVVESV